MKAYLFANERKIPITHDVEYLIKKIIKFDKDFNQFVELDISELSFFAVRGRYPYLEGSCDEEEIMRFFKLAHKFKKLIEKKIYLKIS